jgi:hypothetical protein
MPVSDTGSSPVQISLRPPKDLGAESVYADPKRYMSLGILKQEFVIGGYRAEATTGIDSPLVGYYEGGSCCSPAKYGPA